MRHRCRWLALLAALVVLPVATRAADPAKPLTRIAFGSCAHQDKPQPIWDAILAQKPELFLFVGDNIYADTLDLDLMKAKYKKLAAVLGYQKLLQTCPVLATWDDHDYGANDAGADYPKKVESQDVFLDFFGVPKDSPRRKREGIYDAVVIGPPGKRVQIIVLDTRYHRSALKKRPGVPVRGPIGPYMATDDPKTTVLGEEQWKWLEEQLKVPAELRLIVSSIQVVAEDHGWEKWMNFPHERERLFKLLRDTKAAGVIFLSGDRHLAELSMMDGGVGYPLYDLTSSGLNQAFKVWRPQETNRHRVATMNVGDNFGLLTIDWERDGPRLGLQIRDEEGDVTIQEKLLLSTLQPKEGAKPAGRDVAAEALKHLGKEYTVEMEVKATGTSKTRVFLNSDKDFKGPRNFTAVIDLQAAREAFKKAGIEDPAKAYDGKKVRVTGVVTLFQERPQIVVKDPAQIKIVDD